MEKRIIKFRYWDSFNGVMQYCTPEFKDYLSKFFIEYDAVQQADNNPILMQYTGLKSRSGQEVYHKDILGTTKRPFIVHWQQEEARFILMPIGGNSDSWRFADEIDRMEVLGTLYEHPHLMKQEIK